MGLRDLDLKSAYKSSEDDVLMDFYVPCLAQAVQYDRLAGYFSSSAFSVVAEGLLSFIESRGRMRLICSPELQPNDIEILTKSPDELDTLVSKRMIRAMECANASDLQRDHLMVLAYMLARGLLEIKLAIPTGCPNELSSTEGTNTVGIFHEKIGILRDSEGDVVSFSGSINESATAWLENAEEFKVFRSWVVEQKPYQEPDQKHFDALWNDTADGVRVFSLPEAAKHDMLQRAPTELDIPFLRAKYEVRRRQGVAENPAPPVLYAYQRDAVQAWLDAGRQGIFEMATGTGKTFTALACVDAVRERDGRVLCLVAVPLEHLVAQWRGEALKFFSGLVPIICDSSNPRWPAQLASAALDVSQGVRSFAMAIGTYASLSSPGLTAMRWTTMPNVPLMLVGDEAHRAGASVYRKALLPMATMRLALSATPVRWYDEPGTSFINEYFGAIAYSFPLERAISDINPSTGRTYLVPFEYHPVFAELNDAERRDYAQITLKLARMASSGQTDDEAFKMLAIRRARIIKNAAAKQDALAGILDSLGNRVEHLLVYCTERQTEWVRAQLFARNIRFGMFTMEQGTKPSPKFGGLSEREYLLKQFASGAVQALVAIKCLDEGVDVPPARMSILLASSSSPIEHIQRLGRILRPFPGKHRAIVYDALVQTTMDSDASQSALLKSVESTERRRYEELARIALNGAQALAEIYANAGGEPG